ncbi:hypothetical protein GCM10023149_16060 [Mucilaginibacter gynuensis]|uniref:Tetratricopeptide repeat protein n=1 Tax=Mucilaginibacter gynuensis TaxID=1302236 RepID=A0ABP8G6P1_9SPHI
MITVKFKKALAVLISCVIVLAHPDAIAERSASVKEDSLKIGRLLDKAAELLKKQSNKAANEHLSEAHACQALNLSRRSHYATGVGRSYFVLSEIYQRRNDLESAVRFLDSAISIFKKNELEKVFLADAYIRKADHFEISEKQGLETKIKCYEEAVKLLGSKMPISLKHADALKYLGDLYNVKEDNQRSIARLQEAIAIYRTLRYDKLQDIYCLLGAVMNRNGSSREGLKYLLLAEKAALKYNDSSSTVTTMYNRLGNVYNSLNQLSEANKAFRRSIFYARLNKDVDALLTVSANLGWSFIRIKEPRKGVQVLKDALKYCTSKDTAS